jgi:hypothetical protein
MVAICYGTTASSMASSTEQLAWGGAGKLWLGTAGVEGSMWRRGAMVAPASFCHCVMALCRDPVQQRRAHSRGRL